MSGRLQRPHAPIDGSWTGTLCTGRSCALGARLDAGRCKDRVVTAHEVKVARVHDEPLDGSGARILVDRLWPRGLTKQSARLNDWCKDVAPSPSLREWYGHDPDKFEEFERRYRAELG